MAQSVPHRPRPTIDARRLWSGGVAAALVAGGVAMVGFLLVRGVLDIRVLTPSGEESRVFDSALVWYAVAAAVATLLATAIAHLLIVAAPEPMRFFGWIVGLATAIAVLIPFVVAGALASQVATAAINLAIGITIGSIVGRVAQTSFSYPSAPIA